MKKIIVLAITDFKHVFRDRMLLIFLLAPALLICFVRFFVPWIFEIYPVAEAYAKYIMMFGGIQTSIMFGFITAFMILEEKDEKVLQAIRVLPISPEYFISYRLLFGTFFSTLSAFLMLSLGNLAWPGLLNSILLAVLNGLVAPLITLLIAVYASNKVEGLAFFKGIDLIILIPIIGFFFPEGWRYLASFIPVFWSYELYERALLGTAVLPAFLIGLSLYLVVLLVLVRQFKQRVFNNG